MDVTIRLTVPRVRRRVIAVIAALALAALPGVAAADHLFSDVPNDLFHTNISSLKGAGITAGCGGGKFCPNDPISRGQEAAFLTRGLPRIAMSTTLLDTDSTPADGFTLVAAVTITVPGASGNQFVLVDAEATAQSDATGLGCAQAACQVDIQLREVGGDSTPVGTYQYPSAIRSGMVVRKHHVFAATSGSHTYQLWARLGSGDMLFYADPVITAMSVPFGATGGATLSAP